MSGDVEAEPEAPLPRQVRGFVLLTTGLTWIAMVTLAGVGTMLAAVLLASLAGQDPERLLEPEHLEGLIEQPSLLMVSVLINSGTMAFAALVACGTGPGRGPGGWSARLGLTRVPALDVFVVTLGALGCGAALDSIVYFTGLRGTGSLGVLHRALGSLGGLELAGAALIIGAAPGVGEELFFRGFVQRRLQAVDRTVVAIVVSGVAFGLFHFDLVHTPAAAVLGVYLGFAVVLTGSVWTSVVAHAVNNAVATLLVSVQLSSGQHAAVLGTGVICAAFALRFVARRMPST